MSRARYSDKPYTDAATELWNLTKVDWYVTVEHILTEPVRAEVSLHSDDEGLPTLSNFIGTYDVNESIRLACEYHLETLRKHSARSAVEAPGAEDVNT